MRMTTMAGAVVFALAALAGQAHAGPDWVEQGDAGSFFFSAQRVNVFGQLNTITGQLGATGRGVADLEDCFIVNITNPATFSFGVASPNVRIYVFEIGDYKGFDEAFGLLANDNGAGNAALQNFATDATGAVLTNPGEYVIAISYESRQPVTYVDEAIFNITSATEVSGPDGPGGDGPLVDWLGTGGSMVEYTFELEGVQGVRIPAPTAASLLVLGALGALRRRRLS